MRNPLENCVAFLGRKSSRKFTQNLNWFWADHTNARRGRGDGQEETRDELVNDRRELAKVNFTYSEGSVADSFAYLVSILSWDPSSPSSCSIFPVTFAWLCLRPQLGKSFRGQKLGGFEYFRASQHRVRFLEETRALSSVRLRRPQLWPFGIRFEYVLMICDMFRAPRIGSPSSPAFVCRSFIANV